MRYSVSFAFYLLLISTPAAYADLIQNAAAREHISLNGQWNIIIDPYENGYYNHRYEEHKWGYFKNAKVQSPSDLIEYNFSLSEKIQVPGDWNSQQEKLFLYEGTVWYQKDFSVKKKSDKRYLLHFGAVNYQAIVYLNGEKIGSHEGGFTPFQFDVSEHLKDGDNFVVVKVDNSREHDQVPTVNTDWWNYGGITRPVRLLELNSTYIADYHLQYDDAINGWVQLAGKAIAGKSVKLEIPELNVELDLKTDKNGMASFLEKGNPELWYPNKPKLYRVELEFDQEFIVDEIGFRTIEVSGENILLNGESIFLKGISIHEEAPDREGRAWTEEDARKTLSWAKELGCNFVRLAHYPHNEKMLRMADKMGLLVWAEIPVYWTVQFENEQVYNNAENQLSEMINRDKNRASVVLWSVANETPNNKTRFKFLERLVNRVRELDSSRLVTAAMDTQTGKNKLKSVDDPFAKIVDVIGVNQYCGWYSDKPESCAGIRWESPYKKPVIISEFGAGALYGNHAQKNARWTEEYQAEVYKQNLRMIENMSFVRGISPWILKDFRSPRRHLPEIQDFWNRKGVLSEKGERKLAWKVLNNFYENLNFKE